MALHCNHCNCGLHYVRYNNNNNTNQLKYLRLLQYFIKAHTHTRTYVRPTILPMTVTCNKTLLLLLQPPPPLMMMMTMTLTNERWPRYDAFVDGNGDVAVEFAHVQHSHGLCACGRWSNTEDHTDVDDIHIYIYGARPVQCWTSQRGGTIHTYIQNVVLSAYICICVQQLHSCH